MSLLQRARHTGTWLAAFVASVALCALGIVHGLDRAGVAVQFVDIDAVGSLVPLREQLRAQSRADGGDVRIAHRPQQIAIRRPAVALHQFGPSRARRVHRGAVRLEHDAPLRGDSTQAVVEFRCVHGIAPHQRSDTLSARFDHKPMVLKILRGKSPKARNRPWHIRHITNGRHS